MRHLRQLSPNGNHVDFNFDAAGDEVLVVRDDDNGSGRNDRRVFSVRLTDGARRRLLADGIVNWATHTSCRNVKRPGWCYISEFAASPVGNYDWSANYNEVFAVALDGSGRVERYAKEHHVTSATFDYDAQNGYARSPMAVPSRDGSVVMFASDWRDGSDTAFVHTYVTGVKVQ